jgi:hypothetical protein
VEEAARAVLIERERVTSTGRCWAVQARPRVPLLLLARRKYVMALTDRRVLVFNRRRGGPDAPDLVIGKRYETFTLERVKRRRPLVQVAVQASSGNRLVFEFRRGERELAGEFIARLTPPPRATPSDPDATQVTASSETAAERTSDSDDNSAFWGSK